MLRSVKGWGARDNHARLVSLVACAAIVVACGTTVLKDEPASIDNSSGDASTGGTRGNTGGSGNSQSGTAGETGQAGAAAGQNSAAGAAGESSSAGAGGEGGAPAVAAAFPTVYEGVAVPAPSEACFGASNGSEPDQLPAAYVLSAEDALAEATGELVYYATDTTNLSALASDDENLYLCHGAVVKIPKDGTKPTILARDDCGWGITQAQDRVIWIGDAGPEGGQAIRSISKDGGDISTLATATNALAIAAHGSNIWWSENIPELNGNPPTGVVATSTVAGVPKSEVVQGFGDMVRLAVDARSLVWLSYGAVMPRPMVFRYDRTLGNADMWFDGGWGTDSAGLGFDGSGIYVASYAAGGARLIRIEAASKNSFRELASLALGNGSWSSSNKPELSRGMASNGHWLWVASNGQPGFYASINALPVGGGAPTLAGSCKNFVTDILTDPSGVFVVTSNPTSVWVLPREPG